MSGMVTQFVRVSIADDLLAEVRRLEGVLRNIRELAQEMREEAEGRRYFWPDFAASLKLYADRLDAAAAGTAGTTSAGTAGTASAEGGEG